MGHPTMVRLDPEVHEALASYCAEHGSVKSRVVNLALKAWLGDEPPPAASPQPPADDGDELYALVRDTFDAREVGG
jgi:hypothetical protein